MKDIANIKTSQDAKAANLPVFKIMSNGAVKAYKDEDGTRRFEITASSEAEDLVGDWFNQKALNKMSETAGGMTMFLNHRYNVPDDVFGSVDKAAVIKKNVMNRVLGKEVECLCLIYSGVVTEVNEQAVKTHEMMMEGKVTLGASVSVLITNSIGTKDGRRQIDDVVNLECSIVGLPCNPTSWVTAASKALKLFGAEEGAPDPEGVESASRTSPGEFHRAGRVLTPRTVKSGEMLEEAALPEGAIAQQVEQVDEGRIAKQAFGMMLVSLMAVKQRTAPGISVIQQMATAAKMSAGAVNDILNGLFEVISDETLKAFSEVLGVPVSWPMPSLAAPSIKGIFTDEFTENTANIYFLTGTLEGAYYDLRRGVRAGTVRPEEIEVLLGEGLEEFKAKCVELLVPQLAAQFGQHGTDYDPWGCWSASALEQANRIIKSGVSKAGARNSKSDLERLYKVHDLLVEMGVECKSESSDDGSNPTAEADADAKTAPGADKTAALATELEQKSLEIADLKVALELSLGVAEAAKEKAVKAVAEAEDWKAASQAALRQLEIFGLQPMPRLASAASTGTAQ